MTRCTASDIYYGGSGGLIYAIILTSIYLEQNYLTNITCSSKGPIMYSYSSGTTTILRNCMMRTYTTFIDEGQTFYIYDHTENIDLQDNTVVQCRPEADMGNRITYFYNIPALQVKQNNFSFCRISGNSVFYMRSTSQINISMNTLANDTTAIVYEMYNQVCNIAYENVIKIDHVQNDWGLFFYPTSGTSVTNSLFISIDLVKLLHLGSIDIINCLFFDCSFSASPDIPTVKADTLPFTNTNAHFGLDECITPFIKMKTKGFTKQFEFGLKAFLDTLHHWISLLSNKGMLKP